MPIESTPPGPGPSGLGLEAAAARTRFSLEPAASRVTGAAERLTRSVFLLPAVLALLFLSIFPLLISLYLSFAKFDLVKGGFKITWVGLANYRKLLVGGGRPEFLGRFASPGLLEWLLF